MSSSEDLLQRKLGQQEVRIAELEKHLGEGIAAAKISSRALTKSIKAAAIAIFTLMFTNFVASLFQVQSERSRQVFSAKTDLLQGIIRETSSLEEEARKLQWQLSDEQSLIPPGYDRPGLLYAQARLYTERTRNLLQRFKGMSFPPEWQDPNKPQGIAKQKAWYELFALMACLEKSALDRSDGSGGPASRSVQKAIEYGIQHGELTGSLASEIAKDAIDAPPCANNFNPEVFAVVRARASEATWKHFDEGWLAWFL